ncbi:MAG: dipeptidase [Burkholderiales bacterium]
MLRRAFLGGLLAAGSAALLGARVAGGADGVNAAPHADLLAIDVHSHAWRRKDFAADLRQGRMSAAVMVVTSDRLLINRDSGRLRALGTPAPGQLNANALQQLADLTQAIAQAELASIRAPADLARARAAGTPGVILGFEGADVLEGSLARVGELQAAGTRLLQLVHYRVNELGDIQTEDAVHRGLTPFGADVVRACNRLGIIVDVAHATYDMTVQVAKTTTRPLLLSHTLLTNAPGRYSRGITRDHARAVSETGGMIGVVPFPGSFPTLRDYSEGFVRMADAVGVDHVGIGSDLAGIVGTPPFRRYEQLPALAQALTDRGFSRDDLAKIAGGNFLRVFTAVSAAA